MIRIILIIIKKPNKNEILYDRVGIRSVGDLVERLGDGTLNGVSIHPCIHASIHPSIHPSIYLSIYIYIYIYIYLCVYIYIYIHI